MLRQVARSARVLRTKQSFKALSVGNVRIPAVSSANKPITLLTSPQLLRHFSSSVSVFQDFGKKNKTESGISERDSRGNDDEDVAEILRKSGHGDKLEPYDWYTALHKKNSTETVKQKLQKVENDVARFSSNALAMNYFSDFPSMLEISIQQYGDEVLKPIIEEDLELKEAYDEDKFGTYTSLILQGVSGFEATEIKEQRLATLREEITDDSVYDKVQSLEKAIESIKEEGFDDDKIFEVFENYYSLPRPRAKLLPDVVLEDFLVIADELVADFFEEEQYAQYDFNLSAEELSEIYMDVLESDMKLTADEHLKFLRLNLVAAPDFNEQMYVSIVQGLESENIPLDTKFYCVFLQAALSSNDFTLFEKIVYHLYEAGIDLDRRLFNVMSDYYSLKNDISSWLNLWNLRIDVYKFPISRMEYRNYINSLIFLGEKQLAHSLLSASLYVKLQYINSEEYFKVANDLVKNKQVQNGVGADFGRFIENTGADLSGKDQEELQNLISSSSVRSRLDLKKDGKSQVIKTENEDLEEAEEAEETGAVEAEDSEFVTYTEEKEIVSEMVQYEEPYDIIDFIYSEESREPYMHIIIPEGDFFQMFLVTSESIQEMQQYFELMLTFGVDLDFPNISVLMEEFSDRQLKHTTETLAFFQSVIANIFKYEDTVEYLLLDVDVLMNFNKAINNLFDSGLVDTSNELLRENKRVLENYLQNLSDTGPVYDEEVLKKLSPIIFSLSGLSIELVNKVNHKPGKSVLPEDEV